MAIGKIREKMRVLDSDRQQIGTVKMLLDSGKYFHVDCRRAPDYYIPREHVLAVEGDDVILNVTKQQAGYMGWELRPAGK